MLRATLVLAVAAAASASFVPKLNISSPFTPKDARLLAWQNSSAAKLAVASAALNKTLSPKAAIAAELNITKQAILTKLNKANATCSPGYYTISARRRRALLADNGCAQCGVGYVCPGAPVPQAPAERYECPAGYTTTTPVATSFADCVLPPTPPCSAAVQYMTWGGSGTAGTVAVAGVTSGTWTSGRNAVLVGQNSGGASNTLDATTPWGQTYGTTAGNQYSSFNAGTTASVANPTTLTFTSGAFGPSNQCGFALGDVDSESVQITAIGTDGTPLTAAELGYQSSFNAAGGVAVPTWTAGTSTLAGQGPQTTGETGWFKPTKPIQSITFSSTLIQGTPAYQVFAACFSC